MLKKIFLVFFILIVACVVAGINQYQAESAVFTSRVVVFQFTFFLYFLIASVFLTSIHKKLNEVLILVLIFLPVAILTINGIITNWQRVYPYNFPLQTLVIALAEVVAYIVFEYSFIKRMAGYFVSSALLYLICLIVFDRSAEKIEDKHIETISVNYHQNEVLSVLSKKLIDTNGRKLVLSGNKFYIFNFSTYISAPCQIKLQYLEKFAQKAPENLDVVYIANSGMETFDEFKSKLRHDKDDKIIYAYLYDEDLIKKLDIDKYPTEIMVSPGFRLLREHKSFYDFDANTYGQKTLQLLKK